MTDTLSQLIERAKKLSANAVYFQSHYRFSQSNDLLIESLPNNSRTLKPIWSGIFELGGIREYKTTQGVKFIDKLITHEHIQNTIKTYIHLELDKYDFVTVWGFWYLLATANNLTDCYDVLRFVMNEQNNLYQRIYLMVVLTYVEGDELKLDDELPGYIEDFMDNYYIKDCTVDFVAIFIADIIDKELYSIAYPDDPIVRIQATKMGTPLTYQIYKIPPIYVSDYIYFINLLAIVAGDAYSAPGGINTSSIESIKNILKHYNILKSLHSNYNNINRVVFDIFGYPPIIAHSLRTRLDTVTIDLGKYCKYVYNCIENNQKYWFFGNYYGSDYRLCDNINNEDPITGGVLNQQNLHDHRNPVLAFGDILNFECHLLSDIIANFKTYNNIMIEGVMMSHHQLYTLYYLLKMMGAFEKFENSLFVKLTANVL